MGWQDTWALYQAPSMMYSANLDKLLDSLSPCSFSNPESVLPLFHELWWTRSKRSYLAPRLIFIFE